MCHALIIEDEPLVAMAIEDALIDAGATTIDVAATQDDAIASAARCRPDLITSDVNLLQGTGPAAVQCILKAHGDIAVLFITASPNACNPCAPPGAIMPKPFSSTKLTAVFRTMIG